MKVTLKTITPDIEVNIVEIARVSSSRVDKTEKPEQLINYLLKNKHYSPFQHGYLTFDITTSKAVGIQLLRHYSNDFQEFSQRYSKVESVEPIEFRLQAEKNRQSSTDVIGSIIQVQNYGLKSFELDFSEDIVPTSPEMLDWLNRVKRNLEETLALYQKGLNLNVAKECVRMILPMATTTNIYMTTNVRNLLAFLNVRLDNHAQKEMQLLALEIAKIVQQELPLIAAATNNFNNFQGMFM